MKSNFGQLVTILVIIILFENNGYAQRHVINLNGNWEICKTDISAKKPGIFLSKIPVPGLVDMAAPAIDPPYRGALNVDKGPFANTLGNHSYMYNDALYWYKRKFTLKENAAEFIQLKLNKAMYHTRIYLNGKFAGENLYSFTPTVVDIKPFLKKAGESNELLIAVGCRNNLPDTVCRGDDGEKVLFAPGIYDNVTITLSGSPFITSMQTVPDIMRKEVRVALDIKQEKPHSFGISYLIRELDTKRIVVRGKLNSTSCATERGFDFKIAIPNCKFWSPESPFLYQVEISTGKDNMTARFGMRSFRTDKKSGFVLLNNRPYFMRGTNIAIFRFFEDQSRGNLPWNENWVLKLHRRFKDMHWNSFRNTIGFPPERWYEIADSLGFLIQDEFPLWKQSVPKNLTASNIANEYSAWMKERWNHPSVVIWDAQNESVYDSVAVAINKVRSLDLSDRPWENGFSKPAGENDVMEAHPYLFGGYFNVYDWKRSSDTGKIDQDYLQLMATAKVPGNSWVSHSKDPDRKILKFPIIINEYGWLWLNRDGSPTKLDSGIYKNMFPDANTPEKRFEIYGRILGMKTEYWRAHRLAAGVLYFCGLSYSRSQDPKGQTSDNFIDIKNLVFEPHFYKYLKPAFSPLGVMLNYWHAKDQAGKQQNFPIILINDTYESWKGKIEVSLIKDGRVVKRSFINADIEALGNKSFDELIKLPAEAGKYQIVAEVVYKSEKVRSIREFSIN